MLGPKKQSKWQILYASFWDSECGHCLEIILILLYCTILLFLVFFFNSVYFQGEAVAITMIELLICGFIISIGLLIYSDIQQFRILKQRWPQKTTWELIELISVLNSVEVVSIFIILFLLLAFVVLVYRANVWMIEHNYIANPNNETIYHVAENWTVQELLIWPIIFVFLVTLLYGIAESCKSTYRKMHSDVRTYETNRRKYQQ